MIACPKCRTIQPLKHINTGRMAPCPQCNTLIRADLFNAFLMQKDPGRTDQSTAVSGQSECFYHPGKLAVVACADCGRLLCPVCRVDMEDRPICMTCLQAGRDKEKYTALKHRQVLYDNLAINLALWPTLMVFPTLLTAPAAFFFAIKHLRIPNSVIPKTLSKSILAVLLSIGQMGGWIVFFIQKFGS